MRGGGMQRYAAACCTVFMHKQARLSISRCKHMCGVISPETIGATRLGERCWSLPVRCCRVIRLQQAFPSNRGSEPRELHPGLSKPLFQPSTRFGSLRREGKRGQKGPSLSGGDTRCVWPPGSTPQWGCGSWCCCRASAGMAAG